MATKAATLQEVMDKLQQMMLFPDNEKLANNYLKLARAKAHTEKAKTRGENSSSR
jgi:hypothetical protein